MQIKFILLSEQNLFAVFTMKASCYNVASSRNINFKE